MENLNENFTGLSQLRDEMQITAKRVRLKDKNLNSSPSLSKIPKSRKINTSTRVIAKPLSMHNLKAGQHGVSAAKKVPVTKWRNLIPRPVDYTWNRGGRLKEIRIRTRARKFLHLWMHKTFGKLNFSEARLYRKNLLLKKCFNGWKQVWWDNCAEWKMSVKADCFYRYKTYNKTWVAWKTFISEEKVKNAKKNLADEHYSLVSYQQRMRQWKIYIQLRRTKTSMYNTAYQIAHANLTKKCWLNWCGKIEVNVQEKQNNEIADWHWANATQRMIFTMWKSRYNESQIDNRRNLMASKYHTSAIKLKCLNHWCQYINERRRKGHQTHIATALYIYATKRRMLRKWEDRYEGVLMYRAKLRTCQTLSIIAQKRRYFERWIEFVVLLKVNRRNEAISIIHYRRKLLTSMLLNLKRAVTDRNRKNKLNYLASQFSDLSLKVAVWRVWVCRMEMISENNIKDQSVLAWQHYRKRLLLKCMRSFKENVVESRVKRSNNIKAEAHFIVKALPQYFSQWRNYVDEVKEVNQLIRQSVKFRNDVLQSKYFYEWWGRFDDSREHRTMTRMAIMQHGETTLRSHFSVWVCRTRARLSANHHDVIASLHYRKLLLRVAVRSWKQHTADSLKKKNKNSYAILYYNNGLLASAWLSWQQYVRNKQDKYSKIEKAGRHYNTRIKRICFYNWIAYKNKALIIEAKASYKQESKNKDLVQSSFKNWRDFVESSKEDRLQYRLASCHHDTVLLKDILTRWENWASMRAYHREQTLQRVCEVQTILNRNKLKRAFLLWHEQKNIAIDRRGKNIKAEQFLNKKLCLVALQAWQLYRYLQLKKTLLKRQSLKFSRERITKSYFNKWNDELENKKEENHKTGVALWHWALTLQSKCLENWQTYAKEKRERKSRYEDAMNRRRYRMIKYGCKKMLNYHADMVAIRTNMEATEQAKTRYTAYYLAWKYGKIWIEKAREKIRQREQTQPSTYPDFDEFLHYTESQPPNFKPWVPEPSLPRPIQSFGTCESSSSASRIRPGPRLPEFMDESLQREGIFFNAVSCPPPQQSFVTGHTSTQSSSHQTSPLAPYTPSATNIAPESKTSFSSNSCSGQETEPFPNIFHHSPKTTYQPDIAPSPHLNHESYGNNQKECNLVLLPPSAFSVSPGNQQNTSNSDKEIPSNDEANQLNKSQRHDDDQLQPNIKRQGILVNKIQLQGDKDQIPDQGIFSDESSQKNRFSCEDEFSSDDERSSTGTSPTAPPGTAKHVRDTCKTFVASPSRVAVHEELKFIHEKLQEFQQLKSKLKTLKEQKGVLERWVEDSLPSASLDLKSVGDEVKQIEKEIQEISRELVERKPEVERYALRVRVLSSRPT